MKIVLLFTLLAHAFANSDFLVAPLVRTTANASGIKQVNSHRGAVPEVLQNKVYMYLATFELGGQKQSAIIDTGSSDLWVFDSDSGAAVTYDTQTGEDLGKPFRIRYLDGTSARGGYYRDDFHWGDINVKLQFGVAKTRSPRARYGVFGIADKSQEAAVNYEESNQYENLPSVLKKQGLTQSVSYSINLSGVDEDAGTIVFGAIDTSRFLGKLKVFHVNTKIDFRVPFRVNGKTQIADLDSGTSLCYLDRYLVDDIASKFGAVWDEDQDAYVVSDLPADDLVFDFYGVDVIMPPSELWQPYVNGDGSLNYYLTILPNTHSQGINLLGDSFLRSAYVVYDLDHKQVAIAQADPNPGSPNYVAIGADGIPKDYTI